VLREYFSESEDLKDDGIFFLIGSERKINVIEFHFEAYFREDEAKSM
jgi:hypothetical protein